MKNILKKKNIFAASFILVFVVSVGYITNNQNQFIETAQAQTAEECEGASGNLYGYITTENLGLIYLSTESWNDVMSSNTTSVSFYVDYDRQAGIWSGRGWSDFAGWVDFSYDQINDVVMYKTLTENTNTGGWNGKVDLSNVVYSSQNGSFQGIGNDAHNDTGGVSSDTEDDYIGSGEWTFEGVEFQEPLCPQNVNLFLEGTPNLYRNSCDITNPVIQWTTENVKDCESVEGLWDYTQRDLINTGTSIKGGNITEINSPVLFKLRCIGNFSETPVEGIAIASCGAAGPFCDNPPCDSGDHGMIKPTLIEA